MAWTTPEDQEANFYAGAFERAREVERKQAELSAGLTRLRSEAEDAGVVQLWDAIENHFSESAWYKVVPVGESLTLMGTANVRTLRFIPSRSRSNGVYFQVNFPKLFAFCDIRRGAERRAMVSLFPISSSDVGTGREWQAGFFSDESQVVAVATAIHKAIDKKY